MKVALVGGAPSTQMLAPFDDPSWKIWVLGNQLSCYVDKRIDRIFEIHDDDLAKKPGYADALAKTGVPLVVGEKFPHKGERIKVFPFDKARKFFDKDYLTSSAAYMIALALLEGYREIGLYGFDMAVDDAEYFHQRPCMEAWLGLAIGKGVKITIPDASPVLKSLYMEGRDNRTGCPPFTSANFEAVAAVHQQHIDEITSLREELLHKLNAHHGALQAYTRLAKIARAVEAGQKIDDLVGSLKVRE